MFLPELLKTCLCIDCTMNMS